ncbi:hypothetical protein HMPREF2533_03472 [Bacteroides fragilis]|uniref:Membrane protein n=1 Tax=Bacteroides fragilis (strain ATCC 25285 / DSM 2151 / CCUG 4856 / JCM 11019 / LMG 10263 / NCTC 9343 / Onslow / VPI 2553 / EN-2) TaxID=272559 RepID=Q5L9M3_BACFN|nr:hypothetical protein HMPREF2530_03472 [Bacteroides fragilis]KXU42788.1 hypothetical protein HMPREF2533_03472 [Bacteroides fragilis]CAH09204.1 putative membrane protein [Bacteroides fragilis NCTC 9343]
MTVNLLFTQTNLLMKTNFCRFLIGLVAFVVGIPVMAQTGPDKVKPFSHLSVSLNAGTLGEDSRLLLC